MNNMPCEFCVPEWSPLFAGHFAGNPVLSGVSQLFLMQQVLARRLPGRVLEGFERLRFKATVAPREALTLESGEPNERGQVRVVLRRGAEIVMQGVIRVR